MGSTPVAVHVVPINLAEYQFGTEESLLFGYLLQVNFSVLKPK